MLRVEKLTYEVKGRKLLKDISFQVRKGELLAILGSNGAGKSTLMAMLCGDKTPDSGSITLHGKPVGSYDMLELSKCRAMLSQQQQISLAFKVREIIMMGRYPHFRSNPAARDREVVEEVMKLCGMADFADRVFLSLSGGEQQRVQLARVLAQIWDNPDSLLLLDEPISALDMHYQQKVLAIAKALSRKGLMVVIVVHDVNFAAMYADRILMLKHGRKLFDGPPVEVLNTKDIYTVFSVETTVELNTKTLKPYIRLEEMCMEAHLMDPVSAMDKDGLTVERKRDLLLNKWPYLSVEEQALQLNISEVEALLMDKTNTYYRISDNFSRLFPYFPLLGRVKIHTKNNCCKHTKIGIMTYIDACGDTHSFSGVNMDLSLLLDRWHTGVLAENNNHRALHFFDQEGQEIYSIHLVDGESNLEVFDTIKNNFCKAWEGQQGLRKKIEESKSSYEHTSQHMDMCRIKCADPVFVRKIFNTCALQKLPVTVTVHNHGSIQVHKGAIVNLVDQGDRYMVKDSTFALDIQWEYVGDTWIVSRPAKEGDIYGIALFDGQGKPVLHLFCESQVTHTDFTAWKELLELDMLAI